MWPNIGATYTNSTNIERFLIVQAVQTPAENCLKSGKPLKFLDFDLRQAVLLWECSAQLIWGKWGGYTSPWPKFCFKKIFFGPRKILVLILVRLKKFKSPCYDETVVYDQQQSQWQRWAITLILEWPHFWGNTTEKPSHVERISIFGRLLMSILTRALIFEW